MTFVGFFTFSWRFLSDFSICAGGNNTVALAPSFKEVRAVEINRTLAEAAEDGSAGSAWGGPRGVPGGFGRSKSDGKFFFSFFSF